MAMHLAPHQYSTLNNKRKKVKMTKTRQKQIMADWHAHNKWLRSVGQERVALDDYIDYANGNKKLPKSSDRASFKPLVDSKPVGYRETTSYPSAGADSGVASARPKKEYTGDLVVGIATMHKSNAVPVIDQKQAEEISKMGR